MFLRSVLGFIAAICMGSQVGAQSTQIVSSILPQSRSVVVGDAATAFATIINAGDVTALNCGIFPSSLVPAVLEFRTTDPLTNAVMGNANETVDIPAGQAQSFVFSLIPGAAFPQREVSLRFQCDNSNAAPIADGVNLFRLAASETTLPAPDIIALAITISGDGVVRLADETTANAFAVSTANVGAAGEITVSVDSGDTNPPLTYSLCQTDPVGGTCLAAPAATLTRIFAEDETNTFGIFVQPSEFIPFSPGLYRAVVRFRDAEGVERGSTSVALLSESGDLQPVASLQMTLTPNGTQVLGGGETSLPVSINMATAGFTFDPGFIALWVDGVEINQLLSDGVINLDLEPGTYDFEARLMASDGQPAFPDVRVSETIEIVTSEPPALILDDRTQQVQPGYLALLSARNFTPENELYTGDIDGTPVPVVHVGYQRLGVLIPELADYSGDETLNTQIDGNSFSLPLAVLAPDTIADPTAEIVEEINFLRRGIEQLVINYDPLIDTYPPEYLGDLQSLMTVYEVSLDGLTSQELNDLAQRLRGVRALFDPSGEPLSAPFSDDEPANCETQTRDEFRRTADAATIEGASDAIEQRGEQSNSIAANIGRALVSFGSQIRLMINRAISRDGGAGSTYSCTAPSLSEELRIESENSGNGQIDVTSRFSLGQFAASEPRIFSAYTERAPGIGLIYVRLRLSDAVSELASRSGFLPLTSWTTELVNETYDPPDLPLEAPDIEVFNVTSGVTLEAINTIEPGRLALTFTGRSPTEFTFSAHRPASSSPPSAFAANLIVNPPSVFAQGASSSGGNPVIIALETGGVVDTLQLGALPPTSRVSVSLSGSILTVTPVDPDFVGVISIPVLATGPGGSSTIRVGVSFNIFDAFNDITFNSFNLGGAIPGLAGRSVACRQDLGIPREEWRCGFGGLTENTQIVSLNGPGSVELVASQQYSNFSNIVVTVPAPAEGVEQITSQVVVEEGVGGPATFNLTYDLTFIRGEVDRFCFDCIRGATTGQILPVNHPASIGGQFTQADSVEVMNLGGGSLTGSANPRIYTPASNFEGFVTPQVRFNFTYDSQLYDYPLLYVDMPLATSSFDYSDIAFSASQTCYSIGGWPSDVVYLSAGSIMSEQGAVFDASTGEFCLATPLSEGEEARFSSHGFSILGSSFYGNTVGMFGGENPWRIRLRFIRE